MLCWAKPDSGRRGHNVSDLCPSENSIADRKETGLVNDPVFFVSSGLRGCSQNPSASVAKLAKASKTSQASIFLTTFPSTSVRRKSRPK